MITEDVKLHPFLANDASHDPARVDTNANMKLLIISSIKGIDECQHRHSSLYGQHRMIVKYQGRPEDGHIGVANRFYLRSLEARDQVVHSMEKAIEHLDQRLTRNYFR